MAPIPRSIEERLWERVEKTATCWIYRGYIDCFGYGQIGLGSGHRGQNAKTHRLAYELAFGPIPNGLSIDHMCHNRACCNPAHLQAVTTAENLQNQSGVYRNSQTGVRGVSYDRRRDQYRVRASGNGRRYHCGPFASLELANQAAIDLRNRLMSNNLLDRSAI